MLFDEELSVYEQNGDKWYLTFATYSICIYLYWGLGLANFNFIQDTTHLETSHTRNEKMASRPTVNVRSTSGGNCPLLMRIYSIHMLFRGFLVSPPSRRFDRSNSS